MINPMTCLNEMQLKGSDWSGQFIEGLLSYGKRTKLKVLKNITSSKLWT